MGAFQSLQKPANQRLKDYVFADINIRQIPVRTSEEVIPGGIHIRIAYFSARFTDKMFLIFAIIFGDVMTFMAFLASICRVDLLDFDAKSLAYRCQFLLDETLAKARQQSICGRR